MNILEVNAIIGFFHVLIMNNSPYLLLCKQITDGTVKLLYFEILLFISSKTESAFNS